MRRELTWCVAAALALCACDGDPSIEQAQVESSPEGQALLADVSGVWHLSGTAEDDCPAEASVPFPLGNTQWTDEEGRLVIEGMGAQDITLEFWPLDEATLVRELSASWAGCEATQRHTLEIHSLSGASMSGVFSSVTEVDEGLGCPRDAREAGLPCESRVTWSALRM